MSKFLEARIQSIITAYVQDEARIMRTTVDKVEPVPRMTLRVMATRYGFALLVWMFDAH